MYILDLIVSFVGIFVITIVGSISICEIYISSRITR